MPEPEEVEVDWDRSILPFPPPGGIGWRIFRIPPGELSEPDENGNRAISHGGGIAVPIYAEEVRRIPFEITFSEPITYPNTQEDGNTDAPQA